MKIVAVTHPIPTEYAKRIYDDGKTVFVSKSFLGKVSPGDKFIVYESQGAKAYTGGLTLNLLENKNQQLLLKNMVKN
ncbi:hypothetical protein BK007_02060 [Methanobacterium subterraneum]|uniref:DUF365 domain-containing protein n=1 Tax=Methanobacterium subterraneum TaxID=59277 RepID=A0A2H4VA23_9EURY|nr:hypothetical protein [Methanobacterium subterraneum]AUB54923.1 hypothetical protein BK007_02060 [Methanobacterium subterraneum]